MTGVKSLPRSSRLAGIDSLRFVCAACVFFSHGGSPPVETLFRLGSLPNRFFHVLTGLLWNGPAAVLVFFVISGLCIHLPFTNLDKELNLPEFYCRRFLRLLIPVAAAAPLGHLVNINMTLFQISILWSLLAELIYYTIYPLLRWARGQLSSWMPLIVAAYSISFLLIVRHPRIQEYPLFDPRVVWLLGLPSWLLGCALAEAVRTRETEFVSGRSVWSWRLSVVVAFCICSVLRFHAHVGLPWPFLALAVLITYWLWKEINFYQHRKPWQWLEGMGLWSYSLYLTHLIGTAFYKEYAPGKPDFVHWVVLCAFVFTLCYSFYLMIEKPSHFVARIASKIFERKLILNVSR